MTRQVAAAVAGFVIVTAALGFGVSWWLAPLPAGVLLFLFGLLWERGESE